MLKRMGKKIITSLMIALMVVGIFVSIANFTSNDVNAMTIIEEHYPDRLYVESVFDCWKEYSGDCYIIIIHTGK